MNRPTMIRPMFRIRSVLLFHAICATMFAGCNRGSRVEELTPESTGRSVTDVPLEVDLDKDWPWWRGPERNGQARTEAPTRWSEDENIVWKTSIPGRGHSSPTVCGGAVYLATADRQKGTQSVVAFSRETGAPLWTTVVHDGNLPPDRVIHQKATHANGTVACDGERVFVAFFNDNQIFATALALDGDIVWQESLGGFRSKFGYAPSPIVYKSAVIFAVDHGGGGYVSALDRASGETIWRAKRERVDSYSSPVIADLGGKDQLLISGGKEVVSLNPMNGKLNWRCSGAAESTCGTIVWEDDRLYASGGYPQYETICIDAEGNKVWSNNDHAYEPSMVVHNGLLFLIDDDGIATCYDSKDGTRQWKERLGKNVSSSPVIAGDFVYSSDRSGKTHVFSVSRDKLSVVAVNRLGDDALASPTICHGQIFMRVGTEGSTSGDMLYCIGRREGD